MMYPPLTLLKHCYTCLSKGKGTVIWRLLVLLVYVTVIFLLAIYFTMFLATYTYEQRPFPLSQRQIKRFLQGNQLAGIGGQGGAVDHIAPNRIQRNSEIAVGSNTFKTPQGATQIKPPPTFIPDQPDTSPLGRPSDIPKKFLIEEADFCHCRPGLQVIAYVHSAISRVEKRNLTRTTWANASAYNMGNISIKIGAVFIVGRPKSKEEQRIVNEESQRFHDIVQGDFGDHYNLLTYKGLAALYWINKNCAHIPWTMHADDDVNLDIFLYHHALYELDQEAREKFVCNVVYGPVLRSGKWKVRYEEYAARNYPLFCKGPVWFLQTKLVPLLLAATKSVPFLWVDDAYISGLLARRAGIKHHTFQKFFGGPKPQFEMLGREVAWLVKFLPRREWWQAIVDYHKKHSMVHAINLLPHLPPANINKVPKNIVVE